MEYCVAIRTLGRAGQKYQDELNSLLAQTIKPKAIYVYLPESYPLPKETVGIEKIVHCRKGMVAQRIPDYSDIDTPYCLFLDDDVYLPPDAVEKMLFSLVAEDADCIAADTFRNQDMGFLMKLKSSFTTWAVPIWSRKWAFKVFKSCSFSYNNKPIKDYYFSQSAAGPCSLWRIESFKQIHFEEELWMDKQPFAYGDDLMMFHKLYRNGGKLLVHYQCGVEHLNAKSSRSSYEANYSRFSVRSFFIWSIWKRVQFDAKDLSFLSRLLSLIVILIRLFWELLLISAYSLSKLSLLPLKYSIKGFRDSFCFTRSSDYLELSNFIVMP